MGIEKINSLFFCGCSFTYGEELPKNIRETVNFAGLLGQKLNLPVYNYAKPAGSNDRIQRKTFVELPKLLDQGLTPLIIIPWTQYHRREIFDVKKNIYRNVDFPSLNTTIDEFDALYFTKYSTDADDALTTIIMKLSVQSFLKLLSLPYLFIEAFDEVPATPEKYLHLEKMLDTRYIAPTNLGKIYKGCQMGPNGHPLEQGHQMIADYLFPIIYNTYKDIL